MKFAEEIFPKGTFPSQKSDGYYLDTALALNLDTFAKRIADDMHFLILITGNDNVGNGKSTMGTQVASYLTWKINQLHGVNNIYTCDNEFFKARDLIKNSQNLPKLSVVKLDEGDDLTTHGMKELAVRLKRYFRKCRQLNQIVILVLPSYFELPKFFALSRSHCLINVTFKKEYERGYFDFYSPRAKKLLYIKGKKEWDYDAYPSSFSGVFGKHYTFFPDVQLETKRYLKKKYDDMIDDAKEEEESKSLRQIEKELTIKLFRKLIKNMDVTQKVLCMGFGVSERTGNRWMSDKNELLVVEDSDDSGQPKTYINIPLKKRDNGDRIDTIDNQKEVDNNEDNIKQ